METLLKIASLFLAAYFGHLFTKMKYVKESVYSYKIKAYSDLAECLINFMHEPSTQKSLESIFISFNKTQKAHSKSYIFIPEKIYFNMASILDNITTSLKSFKDSNIIINDLNISDGSLDIKEFSATNPEIHARIINIFSPLVEATPNILQDIKKDMGTSKFDTKFSRRFSIGIFKRK